MLEHMQLVDWLVERHQLYFDIPNILFVFVNLIFEVFDQQLFIIYFDHILVVIGEDSIDDCLNMQEVGSINVHYNLDSIVFGKELLETKIQCNDDRNSLSQEHKRGVSYKLANIVHHIQDQPDYNFDIFFLFVSFGLFLLDAFFDYVIMNELVHQLADLLYNLFFPALEFDNRQLLLLFLNIE